MDFAVFNFKVSFTLHEAVCLTIGLDPRHAPPEIPIEFQTAYELLWESATQCAEGGADCCVWAREQDLDQDKLHDALLHPEWATRMVRLPGRGRTEVDMDRLEAGAGPIESWTFVPWTIAAWLSARDVTPVYDFAASDRRMAERGARVLANDETLAKVPRAQDAADAIRTLGTRERRTLLAMIAALCKAADIDPLERSAAAKIATAAQTAGLDIPERTVRSHIALIREAMESKQS